MSGWIKVEKDLETDPRVLRMSKALERKLVLFRGDEAALDPCNAIALPTVTLVVGALARLWIYADSHARDDDTLDLSTSEIDELLGIPGFCSLMPEDWLVAVDERTVELPGFQAHNNVEAKKRDLTQKRVERHRSKQKRGSVTARNAPALPDQDQTRPKERDGGDGTTTRNGAHIPAAQNDQPPLGLNIAAWDTWAAYRKGIKKPIKAASLEAAMRKLAEFGDDQLAVVEQSVANGWQGLFPLKDVAAPNQKSGGKAGGGERGLERLNFG